MRLRYIGFIALMALVMTFCACGTKLNYDGESSVPIVYFSDGKCYLNFLTGENIDQRAKIKICEDGYDGLGCPVYCQKVDKDWSVAIGNYDEAPLEYYVYNGDDNRLIDMGELLTNICCFSDIGKEIYVVRKEFDGEKSLYYLEGYEKTNLEEKICSTQIYGAPQKMLYDENENVIYMYTIGNEKATVLGKYSITDQSIEEVTVDELSYASDFEIIFDCIYITMSGWSENENVIYDNRILSFDKNLNLVDVKNVDKSPEFIDEVKGDIYVYFANDQHYINRYDKDMNFKECYDMPDSYIMASCAVDEIIYYHAERTVFLLTERGILRYEIQGTNNTIL